MTNKVGIGVQAELDVAGFERQLNAMGQKVAAANRVQFTPFSKTAIADVQKMQLRFEQLLKIHGDLSKRMKATGQSGSGFLGANWDQLYPDTGARSRQMLKVMQYIGGNFSAMPQAPKPATPAGGGGGGGGGGHPAWATTAAGVAQAGLRPLGGAGSVAANAIGTGMTSGAGAGLWGLLGGMLALGVGKVAGAAMERLGVSEDNAVAMDRLKRSIGDVSVSFNALKAAVHGSADRISITYGEAGQLAQQFVRQSGLSASKYRTIGGELETGVGMSRAFGLDPSQGVGVLGQMRGLGVTSSTQESRRFALLIGETIGKSGAFAKAEDVMDAITAFATSQTRLNMGAANVAGYSGMFSSLVGSGIPGMDPQGAAGLLARVNSSLSAGGAKGEASQFFTAMIGSRLGLDPVQTQIYREGGAFATNSSMFGDDSVYRRYMGSSGPGGDKTFLQATLEQLRGQYGSNKGLLAQATSNHLGIGINQAMAMLSVNPNAIGDMQKYGDLGKLSASGIGNLAKSLYGSGDDRQSLAQSFLGRDDVSSSHKNEIVEAMKGNEDVQREVLARISAQYDQEKTTGSDIRDSKNALDNIKTNLADYLVPIMQEVRHGIMYMAGVSKGKTSEDVMREVIAADSAGRARSINGRFTGQIGDLQDKADNLRARDRSLDPVALAHTYRDRPEVLADKLKERGEVQKELASTEKKIAALEAERAGLLKKENERRDSEIKRMEKDGERRAMEGLDPAVPGSAPSAPGNQSISRRRSSGGGGGRSFTSPGVSPEVASKFAAAEQAAGLPPGTMSSLFRRETSGNIDYLNDPSRYHYGLNAQGKRIAGHTGRVSTAFGPFGILESTAARPGYGVAPLRDKSLDEQIRFASQYLAARSRSAGSLQGGLAGYGEGEAYASGVMAGIPATPVPRARSSAGAGRGGGPVSGEMSLRLDLSPDARRLLQPPQAPVSGSFGPAAPFGAQ